MKAAVSVLSPSPAANGVVAAAAAPALPLCLPARFTKTVHFIRHGEAWSNVYGEVDHAAYRDERWFDASLSANGWAQAERLGKHVAARGLRPQLVVVSPLTRALQTAAAAFGTGPHEPSASSEPPLMVAYEAIEGEQVAHGAISAKGAPPMVMLEIARERLHGNPCDRRRPVAWYKDKFPAVSTELMEQETDVLWQPGDRETQDAMQVRGAHLLAWLLKRPESEIAVVSHSGFMHATMTNFLQQLPKQSGAVDEELDRWFENCELRTMVLAVPDAEAELADTSFLPNFPGGGKHV